MVIQRIQTLYLLIAIILMAVFAFLPALVLYPDGGEAVRYGALQTGQLGATHVDPLLLVLVVLIIFLAIVDIFQYRNLPRQMTLCFVDIIIALAMLVAIGIQAFVLKEQFPGVKIHGCMGNLLPVGAIVMMMLAHHAMSRDRKKLIDSDRLR